MNFRLAMLIAIEPSSRDHAHWIIANDARRDWQVCVRLHAGPMAKRSLCFCDAK
jgi:hypothetical protein